MWRRGGAHGHHEPLRPVGLKLISRQPRRTETRGSRIVYRAPHPTPTHEEQPTRSNAPLQTPRPATEPPHERVCRFNASIIGPGYRVPAVTPFGVTLHHPAAYRELREAPSAA